MSVRFTDLHCKEVICVGTGQRLGYVVDVLVELPEGKITAIVVPGPCRLLGLAGREDDFLIPWCKICRIGPDIVLVDIQPDKCRVPRLKREWPFCQKP
ncbi:MAG TPA: YlmC/YmxH family sporulation protein [Candidatus Faecousia intestinigallinarum]|nr:YlmC/YmxH family sporulation protein [Candidatus Faecousia intestinigallinarum]